jgi:hypothetical protein
MGRVRESPGLGPPVPASQAILSLSLCDVVGSASSSSSFVPASVTPLNSRPRTLGKVGYTSPVRGWDKGFRDANLYNGSELIDRQRDNKLGNVNEPGRG